MLIFPAGIPKSYLILLLIAFILEGSKQNWKPSENSLKSEKNILRPYF